MTRPRKSRRRSALSLGQRLICFAIAATPPVVLAVRLGYGYLDYLDGILSKSAPIASVLASGALGREVQIGSLSPFLSVSEVWSYWKRLDKLGTIPVAATEITIANGENLATSGELAYARRITAYVSIPTLLSGKTNTAVTAIDIESPRLFLVRRKDGTFNVQDLVKKKKGPPGPPFLTTITVMDAAVRFTDRATKYSTPQTNQFYPVSATATLGASSLRFDAHVTPKAGTPTAQRVRGPVTVSGSAAQGEPGTRPDAARTTDAQYTANLSVPEADAPYWVSYLNGSVPNVTLKQGRIRNVAVTLVGPTVGEAMAAQKAKTKAPGPSINASALLAGFEASIKNVPTPITNGGGPVRFNSTAGLVSFDATAAVFGEQVAAKGSLWDLTKTPDATGPHLAVRIDAPRIPLSRVLPAFKVKLPANISVNGEGSASGFVSGTPNDLAAVGHIAVPEVAMKGTATARAINADLSYSRGTLAASNVTAQTDLGGAIAGNGRVRFGEITNGGKGFRILPQNQIAATFAARADQVPLRQVADLLKATKTANQLKLTGTGSVAATGSLAGKNLSLTADVATKGLTVGGLPFTVAAARVLVRNNQILVPAARFVSPTAGSISVSGNTSLLNASASGGTPLSLKFAIASLDAGRIARAFGVANVDGLVQARGTVTGSVAAPRLNVERLAVLNPRYQKYSLQSVTGGNITVTKQGVSIDPRYPVIARRLPATVSVSGNVMDIFPAQGKTKARPILALDTHVRELDYSTVAPFLPKPKPEPGQPATKNDQPFAGTLTEANARITGFADAPTITGDATLRRMLVGTYPVDSGTFQFSYANGEVDVLDAKLQANVGTITSRKVTITKSGYVYGTFKAPALNLARLSFLTEKTASLDGTVDISGSFSGTRSRPIVTVSVAPSDIVVAGTPINDLTATNIRYIANLEAGVQRIEVPEISLSQAGDTRLTVTGGSYDFKRKAFHAVVAARSASIGDFITEVRRSGFSQTKAGRQVFDSVNRLPSVPNGALPATRPNLNIPGATLPTNQFTIDGKVGNRGLDSLNVSGDLYVTDVSVGQFVADRIALVGNFAGAAVSENKADGSTAPPALRGNITVDGASIVSGVTTINASGTAGLGPAGRINALVDTNEASLDLVRAFVPSLPVYGKVSLSIIASGRTESPDIQASLEGSNLVVAPPGTTATVPDTPPPATVITTPDGSATALPQQGMHLSLVRAIARIAVNKEGKRYLELTDTQVARADGGKIEAEARLPFTYGPPYILPDEPLEVKLTLPQQDLRTITTVKLDAAKVAEEISKDTKKKKPSKKAKPAEEDAGTQWTNGTAQGTIMLAGTLRKPELSGNVTVTDAAYRFPKVSGKDPMNPINDLDLTLTLAGTTAIIDSKLTLGKPNGGKGDAGSVTVAGSAEIKELETVLNSLGRGTSPEDKAARTAAFGSGTTFNDITATFDKFTPEENNLLGLNEAFKGQINGKLVLSRTLNRPNISTIRGNPITVTGARIIPPGESKTPQTEKKPYPIDPTFDIIRIEAPTKATLAYGSLFNVDVTGGATIRGSLSAPVIESTFFTQSGVLQYAIRRLTIDKNGIVRFNYGLAGSPSGELKLEDVTARTTVYLPPGVSPDSDTSGNTGGLVGFNQPSNDGRGSRYRITAKITGRIPIGDNAVNPNDTLNIDPTSDPYLTKDQIISLLIPRSQIAAVTQGNFQVASRQLFDTAFQSAVIPGLFSPIEQRVASAFGLEQFSVDYATSAPLTINLSKRLPDPLDRFVVSYSRSLQSGTSRTGEPVPYTLGISYELFQLRTRRNRPVPRIQFGFTTNEQQDYTTSLRATLNY